MTNVLPKLGPGIARLRNLYGWNQKELAEKIGYGKSYVSEIESGHKIPKLDFLHACAKAFELTTSLLVLFIERRTDDRHDPELFVEIQRLNDEIIRSE